MIFVLGSSWLPNTCRIPETVDFPLGLSFHHVSGHDSSLTFLANTISNRALLAISSELNYLHISRQSRIFPAFYSIFVLLVVMLIDFGTTFCMTATSLFAVWSFSLAGLGSDGHGIFVVRVSSFPLAEHRVVPFLLWDLHLKLNKSWSFSIQDILTCDSHLTDKQLFPAWWANVCMYWVSSPKLETTCTMSVSKPPIFKISTGGSVFQWIIWAFLDSFFDADFTSMISAIVVSMAISTDSNKVTAVFLRYAGRHCSHVMLRDKNIRQISNLFGLFLEVLLLLDVVLVVCIVVSGCRTVQFPSYFIQKGTLCPLGVI